jgi:hypothetical protein
VFSEPLPSNDIPSRSTIVGGAHKQQGDLISLLFSQNTESRFKTDVKQMRWDDQAHDKKLVEEILTNAVLNLWVP